MNDASTNPGEPYRQSIVDTLDAIQHPVPARTLHDLMAAGGSPSPVPKELVRMVRRDQRRFDRTTRLRPDGLVPGVSAFGLVPVAGTIALAAWPIEDRIVGSRTPRIAHLRALLALLDGHTPAPVLVARYAGTLAGSRAPDQVRFGVDIGHCSIGPMPVWSAAQTSCREFSGEL